MKAALPCLLVICFAILSGHSQAQEVPLEISADNTLEWRRAAQQYVARGNAVAVQGDIEVKADQMTADYTQGANGATIITRLTATGNLKISSLDGIITGETAVYTVADEKAVITGETLKLNSDTIVVTAQDRLEYYRAENRFAAVGRAKVTEENRTIEADNITAWIKKEAGKKPGSGPEQEQNPEQDNVHMRGIERAEARGNVVITTETDKAISNYASYDGTTEISTLKENVVITRGQNTLKGARAEVNLRTGISQVFGAGGTGSATGSATGRVTGTFFTATTKSTAN